MQTHDSHSTVQDRSDDSLSHAAEGPMLTAAFAALPDAAFLFGSNNRLIKTNGAAALLPGGRPLPGTKCCEMFWHVADADGCVVDRAMQTIGKVEVEIQIAETGDSISIIVEPLAGDAQPPAALVNARDISDLRRAEAEALRSEERR